MNGLAWSLLFLIFFISVVVTMALVCDLGQWLIITMLGKTAAKVFFAMVLMLPFYNLMYFIAYFYQGMGRFYISYCLINTLWSILFLLYLMINFDFIDISFLVDGFLFAVLVSSLVALFFFMRSVGWPSLHSLLDLNQAIKTSRSGLVLLVSHLASYLVLWLPIFILGNERGPVDVAHYQIGLRLAMVVGFVNYAISAQFAPLLAALSGNKDNFQNLTFRASTMSFLFAAALALPMLIFSSELLLIFGDEYQDFYQGLKILLCAEIFVAATGISGIALVMAGYEIKLQQCVLAASILTLVSSLVLIPTHGAFGAALAGAFGVVFGNMASTYKVRKHIGYWILPFRRL